MSLDVTITAETGRAFAPFLREQLRAAHDVLAAPASRPPARAAAAPSKKTRSGKMPRPRIALREMSLALVGDARMSDLHHQFMGIRGPTDVLTFPIDHDDRGGVTSGEVVVCVPQARREAKRRTIPVRLELLLYSVHGMLHLLGYDDRTARDFHTMHRTEDDILTALGFGPVFASAPAPAPAHRDARPRDRRVSSSGRRRSGGAR